MCTTLASTPSLHLSPGPRRPRIHRLTPSLLLAGLWGLVLTAALLSSLPGGVVGDARRDAREPSATPATKEPRVLANTGADTPCPLPPAPRTGDASTGPEHEKVRVPAHSQPLPHVLLWGVLGVREHVRARARAVSLVRSLTPRQWMRELQRPPTALHARILGLCSSSCAHTPVP